MKRMRALAGAAIVFVFAACDATSYYLYTGHEYDPKRGCVNDLSAIDIDIGTDPGASCGAQCLHIAEGDASTIYATTMCGPAPAGADTSGSNGNCPAALAALARGDICLDGGGSTDPLDAGAD